MGAVERYEGKRESYWVYRIDLPPDPRTGRRRQKRVSRDRKTGERWTSKRACRQAMQAHELELRTGVPVETTQQTLAAFMVQWLNGISSRVSPSTVVNYRDCWKRISPYLPEVQVQQLQTLTIQQAIRSMEQRYAPDTIRLTYTILHIALNQAVQWNLIARNPADGVVLPARKPVRRKSVWTVEETQRFLEKTRDDPLHPLWRLLLDTGMRIGEALALDWSRISLDTTPARVRIDRTLTRTGSTDWLIGTTTKTRRGRRTLAIQPETAEALKALRIQQEERRVAYGDLWNDSGLVFSRDGGGLLLERHISKKLEAACAVAGVPRRTPHELRHTFTTLAAQRGVPLKLIADRLGHANTDLIAAVYAHVTEEGDLLVTEALRDILSPPIPTDEATPCQQDGVASENPSNGAESSDQEYYRA